MFSPSVPILNNFACLLNFKGIDIKVLYFHGHQKSINALFRSENNFKTHYKKIFFNFRHYILWFDTLINKVFNNMCKTYDNFS